MKTKALLLTLVLTMCNVLFAEEKDDSHKEHSKMTMTQEERTKMAEMHEKMALCLRSSKPLKECKKEMKKAMHEDGCPMMEKREKNE